MKKTSNLTPKELSKKRLAQSTFMKMPSSEGKFHNKENQNPIINIKSTHYKTRDRKVQDGSAQNPFDLPQHMREFSGRSKVTIKSKPEPFIMNEIHTICDVDETFYKIIEGRPLRQFSDIKVYMKNIRDITLSKANAAYLKDQSIQIEDKFALEMEEYNKIFKLYARSVSSFVQFAKESYQIAKVKQKKAEEKAIELARVVDQLEAYSFEYVRVRNQLGTIAFNFDTLSMYAKFLHFISPQTWQDKVQIKEKGRNSIHFSEFSHPETTSKTSVDQYKATVSKYTGNPPMYFKRPRQIMMIFDDLRRQCLNYMQIDVLTTNILQSIQRNRSVLKDEVKCAIAEMEEFIEDYKQNVVFYEKKADDYKNIFEKLLMSEFQDLFSSYENTKLFTCVQYVNTRVFEGPEDPKDSVSTLMHQLEKVYLDVTAAMDALDNHIVNAATKEFFAEDIKMMNRAHKAQRELKECNILRNALYESFKPPRRRQLKK